VAAYGLWGVIPLYFKALGDVSPLEVLAHRIVWCFVLLAAVLTAARRWPDFARSLRDRRTLALLVCSSLLVAANWLVYIHGVATHRVTQTSLGYFINPLFSVVLGMVFFRERLRPGQWAAVALAAAGVGYLLAVSGDLPWIPLALAGSFGLYGLVRKIAPVDALTGLTAETLILLPPAVGLLLCWGWGGVLTFGRGDVGHDGLLAASGVVTALPLLCFGQAARRLPLSMLGFLQYLAPSVQFVLALTVFGEPFRPEQQRSFGLVWAGLALFTVESVLAQRGRGPVAEVLPPETG
jgi:chloramphenicol-sensitive protein RarD